MKRLNADDLQIGMYITATPKVYERNMQTGSILTGDVGVVTVRDVDRSYGGNVYRVECIDRPYMVVVQVASRSAGPTLPGSWDSKPMAILFDEFPWYEVSDEFLAAMGVKKEAAR